VGAADNKSGEKEKKRSREEVQEGIEEKRGDGTSPSARIGEWEGSLLKGAVGGGVNQEIEGN